MSDPPTSALVVFRSVIAVALTACAVLIELTVGRLATEFTNWIQYPAGVNAVEPAGWWMAMLLVGHIALLSATLRPRTPSLVGRIVTVSTVIGMVTSVMWAVVLLFLIALGSTDNAHPVSTVINAGIPLLHVGLFLTTAAIASTRVRPGRTIALVGVVVVACIAVGAVLAVPPLS